MATAAPQLALPSGERTSDPSATVYGVIALGVSVIVMMGALMGAWLAIRSGTRVWPPKGAVIENYYGTTLSITMIMSALAGWWALYGVVRGSRRQAEAGLALCVVLEGAFINLMTYVIRGVKFGPGTHAYGTLYYAMNVAVIAVAITGMLVAGVALVRSLGGQVSPRQPQLGWSAAWYGTLVAVAWFVMYAAVYVVK